MSDLTLKMVLRQIETRAEEKNTYLGPEQHQMRCWGPLLVVMKQGVMMVTEVTKVTKV